MGLITRFQIWPAFFLYALCLTLGAEIAKAQTSSFGPGKGPPSPGMGSKYTYPQPQKPKAAGTENIKPAAAIPDTPEKFIWKLTNKNVPVTANSSDVPVYFFDPFTGKRKLAGQAKVGDEITLDEFRAAGGRHHYKFKWNGSSKESAKFANIEYWIDGVNIEYAGKK